MTSASIGRGITFFFFFVSFVLYFLLTISTPTTTSLNFLHYTFNTTQNLKIGIFGSCVTNLTKDLSTGLVNYGEKVCTKASVGFLVAYTLLYTSDLTETPGRSHPGNPYVVGNLASAMILYVLAAIFAFIVLLLILADKKRGWSHSIMPVAGACSGLGAAGMICSFILFERTDTQIHAVFSSFSPPGNLVGGLGNCNWIALTAALCSGTGMLFSIMIGAEETSKHGTLIEKQEFESV